MALHAENSVVWYELKLRGYPRWPCKVTNPPDHEGRVTLESFEDHEKYTEYGDKLTPFVHADVWNSCAKDIAKCRNRPSTLAQYKQAIKEALEFEKNNDPHFCPPSELEEFCRSTAPLSGGSPCSSGHTPASPHSPRSGTLPSRGTSDLRKKDGSGASPNTTQPQFSVRRKKRSVDAGTSSPPSSDTCSSEHVVKRRRGSQGATTTSVGQLRKKDTTARGSSLLAHSISPSNAASKSCSTSLSCGDGVGAAVDGDDARDGVGDGGIAAEKVVSGSEPQGGWSHQSVGWDATKRKLFHNNNCTTNGESTPASTNGESISASTNGESISASTNEQGISASTCTNGKNTSAMASMKQRSSGSEGSDDDDLPSIDMTPVGSIRVQNLKGGEIIWAKYGRFPFWPAMVMGVNRGKKKAMVNFLGWNPDERRIGIANKNIAPFNYSQQESFLQQGRTSQWAEMFSLAFEEANTLLREDISGTPTERLLCVIARRPKGKQYAMSPMTERHQGLMGDGTVMCAKADSSDDDDVMDNTVDSSSDEENVSPEYRYDVLRAEFEILKPELLAIVEGKVTSDLHRLYCHGSKSEKKAMKQSTNFGPASKLPTKLQNQLLAYLETIAREATTTELPFGRKYCYEVLFPEAMMRIVAKRNSIPQHEAAMLVLQETMLDCLHA